jgi:hypothetical protein
MKIVFVYSLFFVSAGMGLLISVPGASLSAGKNYEKAQLPAFSKSEFSLGAGGEPPRRRWRLRGLTCPSDPAGL